MTKAEIGKRGEDVACNYLKERGFTILKRNWRVGHLEVDIIAKRDAILHFVEVKARSGTFLPPSVNISGGKSRFLIGAANAYIAQTGSKAEVKIDFISVTITPEGDIIEFVPNAITPHW